MKYNPDLEDRVFRARTKLSALTHLLSQYEGGTEFSDEAVHGLAMILQDIDDEIELKDVPAEVGRWTPEPEGETANGVN